MRKRISIIILIAIILTICTPLSASASGYFDNLPKDFATTGECPEGWTELTVRIVMPYQDCLYRAQGTFTITRFHRIGDMDYYEGAKTISISRDDNWQKTVYIHPGYETRPKDIYDHSVEFCYYQISSFDVKNYWQDYYICLSTPFFSDPSGTTIYARAQVSAQYEDKPIQMPDQDVVYGQDNQKFHIWGDKGMWGLLEGDESDESDVSQESAESPAESAQESAVESSDVSETLPDESEEVSEPVSETPSEESRTTAGTGATWILIAVLVLLIGAVATAIIILVRKRNAS